MQSSSITFKWITFRVINYLHIVAGFSMVVLSIVTSWPLHFSTGVDFLMFVTVIFAFSVFVANGLSNLWLMEKCYPDQLPSRAASRFNLVTYIFLVIESLVLLIFFLIIIFDSADNSTSEVLATAIFGGLAISCLPIWILQARLRHTLSKNYYTAFDQFLENEEV